MEKRILVPTDFSEHARNALKYALNLYKNEECVFYLLNVFSPVYFTTETMMLPEPGDMAYDSARADSEAGLKDVLKQLKRRTNLRHRFETIALYHTVLGGIHEVLDQRDIDMVVMGTKGDSDPDAKILGSNAADVMENLTACPVLVVPEAAVFSGENKREIVLAVNYKLSYRRNKIAPLIEIAGLREAAIRVLYVGNKELDEEQQENKAKLGGLLKKTIHSFHVLTKLEPAQGIHAFIESRGSSMLALVHIQHGFFKNLFSKTLFRELGYEPGVPILVLQE